MEDISVVKRLQALDHLNEDAPDVIFSEIGLLFLVACDLLEQVTVIGILHDNATKRLIYMVRFWIIGGRLKALLSSMSNFGAETNAKSC